MKIKTDSWHYRLIMWITDNQHKPHPNICKYFWQVIFCLAISPFKYAGVKIENKLGDKSNAAANIFLISVCLYQLIRLGILKFLLLALLTIFALAVLGGIVWLLFFRGAKQEWDEESHSWITEYLNAKATKTCPLIEFEDEKE